MQNLKGIFKERSKILIVFKMHLRIQNFVSFHSDNFLNFGFWTAAKNDQLNLKKFTF